MRMKYNLEIKTKRQVFHMSCTSNVKNLSFQVSAITQPSALSHVTPGVAPKLRKSLDERGGWEVSEGREGRRSGN